MRYTAWIVVSLLIVSGLSARAEEDSDPTAALKAKIVALRKSELKRLEIHLAAEPMQTDTPALLLAVRIERRSEIVTFLLHLQEAAMRRVLVLGPPQPPVASIVVEPLDGTDLRLDVTVRAFRISDGTSGAFVFQSPALLRWIEDRVEMPHYDLREEKTPDLAALSDTFTKNTTGLTREHAPQVQGGDATGRAGIEVRNGGFEEELVLEGRAKGSPLGWDRVDGLTTFWKDDAFPRDSGSSGGKALVMDTDVLESEWLRRKEEMARDPDSEAPLKTLVEPARQYATVGATYGVSYYSAPITIEKGRAYRITLDFRAAMSSGGCSKVWVRGYGKLEVRGEVEWRRIYDSLHTLRTDDPTWHTYTNVFHPTKNTPRVERIRVMLYSYWPRGEYRWDDIHIAAISDAEYREAKTTERSDVK